MIEPSPSASDPAAPAASPPPAVSVVMATYNRSNIIGYAIDSVLRGTFQDWELIVVGDCCTDDTEAVVLAVGDPRIRFVNLAANFGEQSGPNNCGTGLARGRYLAFLNHDDLWFPHHLQHCIDALEREDVDLVFSQGLVVDAPGAFSLTGATCAEPRRYAPWMGVPASLWVMRRAVVDVAGPWPAARDTRISPSQAWLRKAHADGVRMRALPVPDTLIIPSGSRHNSYRDRQSSEHARWHATLTSEGGARELIGAMLGEFWQQRTLSPGYNLAHLLRSLVRRGLLAFGIPAPSIKGLFRFRRKGAFIRHLRRVRGLEPHEAVSGARKEDRE